jgi:AmiR/NasT family two-component response regulator
MDERGLSEAEAFRSIQKQAMDQRRPMRSIAEEILAAATNEA